MIKTGGYRARRFALTRRLTIASANKAKPNALSAAGSASGVAEGVVVLVVNP